MPFQPTFFAAVSLGDADVVKILIDHGVETQTRDPDGHTALQLAKLHNRSDVMQVLREHKSAGLSTSTSRRPSDHSVNIANTDAAVKETTDSNGAPAATSMITRDDDGFQAPKPSSDWALSKNKKKKMYASKRRGFGKRL